MTPTQPERGTEALGYCGASDNLVTRHPHLHVESAECEGTWMRDELTPIPAPLVAEPLGKCSDTTVPHKRDDRSATAPFHETSGSCRHWTRIRRYAEPPDTILCKTCGREIDYYGYECNPGGEWYHTDTNQNDCDNLEVKKWNP